jgi:hypothetical protein
MKAILTLLFLLIASFAVFAQNAPVLFAPDMVSTELMETTATTKREFRRRDETHQRNERALAKYLERRFNAVD